MENTQLAFLTSLGGKLSGEKAAGGKPFAVGDDAENDRNGFFAILNRLLTAGAGGEDAQLAQPTPLQVKSAEGDGPLADFPLGLTTEPVKNVSGEPLGNDEPLGNVDVDTGLLDGGALEELGSDVASEMNGLIAAASVENAAPLNPKTAAGDSVVSIAAPKINGPNENASNIAKVASLAGQAAQQAKPNLNLTAPVPEAGIETPADARVGSESGEPLINLRQPQGNSAPAAPQLPQAAQKVMPEKAQAENAILSAGVEGDAPAIERSALTRAEVSASTGPDKALSINPVRDQIVAAVVARNGEGRLEVRLDPPELGRVTISFESSGGELVRAVISADTPETLDLMRRNADAFQRALGEQGFDGLDLQFAERGAENAGQDDSDKGRAFVLGADADALGLSRDESDPAARYIELGRLDRRL